MNSEELVRGKARQRRKAPKTRSGCITCKIRRIKCDEGRPSCVKCTSTGRTCDRYEEVVGVRSITLDASTSRRPLSNLAVVPRAAATEVPEELYEPTNTVQLPIWPLAFLPGHVPGRAFHYFIHKSSLDLTGPLHSHVWREYILSVCATSPAVQHAVVALSGFHERYTLPKGSTSEEQCWRQYYLAVKSINLLVQTSCSESGRDTVKEEILLACAVFITIEILLGNTEGAVKHLEGGLALIQAYLTKRRRMLPLLPLWPSSSCPTETLPSSLTPHLDDKMADLIGWYARLDLQILSFLPSRHHSSVKPSSPPMYAIPQLSHPLPNAPSASLFRLMKHALYWIRYFGTSFKYSSSVPDEVQGAQKQLLLAFRDWFAIFQASDDPFNNSKPMDVQTANLLVAYHLAILKLTTALSPLETAFDAPECRDGFREILRYSALILVDRNPCGAPLTLPDNYEQQQFFFSLESCTIEPLYYTALKCRDMSLRRSAVYLMQCAGREGVWDCFAMTKVAEHVIAIERGGGAFIPQACSAREKEVWLRRVCAYKGARMAYQTLADACEGANIERIPEEKRVNTVSVDLDRENRSAEVECGWFVERERTWRHESKVLQW